MVITLTPEVTIRAYARGLDRYQAVTIVEGDVVELHQEMILDNQRYELPVIRNRAGKRADRALENAIAFVEAVGFFEITIF